MFQIMFDHLIRHLPNRGAKIASRPKMPSPVSFLQVRKLLKQMTRSSSLDSSHDFTGRHSRGRTHQNMDMVFAHHASYNPNFKGFTSLPYQVPYSFRYISLQNFVAVFAYPNKMVFNLINRMATIPRYSISTSLFIIITAKADRLKPVV